MAMPEQMYSREERLLLSGARGALAPAAARGRLIVAYVFAHEDKITKMSWRDASPELRDYYAQLIAWGYEPGEVDGEIGVLPKDPMALREGPAPVGDAGETGEDDLDDEDVEDDEDLGSDDEVDGELADLTALAAEGVGGDGDPAAE
jgi:hypothetical protein